MAHTRKEDVTLCEKGPVDIKEVLKETAAEGKAIKRLKLKNCISTEDVFRLLCTEPRTVKQHHKKLEITIANPKDFRLLEDDEPRDELLEDDEPWDEGLNLPLKKTDVVEAVNAKTKQQLREFSCKKMPSRTVFAVDAALGGADEVAFAIVSVYPGSHLVVQKTGAIPKIGKSGDDNDV